MSAEEIQQMQAELAALRNENERLKETQIGQQGNNSATPANVAAL